MLVNAFTTLLLAAAARATIVITSPTAGTQWLVNSTQTVTWTPKYECDDETKFMLLMNNTLSSSEVDDEIAIWNNIPIETGSYTFQVPAKYTAGEGFQILFRRPYYNAREVIARSELIALVDPQAPSPSASAEPEPTDQCPGVVQRSAKRSRRSRK